MKTPSRNLSQRLVLYGVGATAVTGIALAGGNKNKTKNHVRYSGPVEFDGNEIWFDLQDFTPPSTFPNFGDDFKLGSFCGYSSGFKHNAFVKGKTGHYSGSGEKAKIAVHPGKYGEPDATQFQAGDTIGTQDFFFFGFMDFERYNSQTENFYAFGSWQPGDRGFLGLKIIIDCVAYYGWADVTLNTLNCENGPVFTLHSYAINLEPNESIAAGEKKTKSKHLHLPAPTCTPTPTATPTPTPPVPSTGAALGLLISGAAGIATLKQRRM